MALARFKRWLYPAGRPNLLARIMNRGSAMLYSLGIAPNYLVTLEVRSRRSGRTISLPLVMVVLGRERYLVSMLGTNAGWVRNIQAADGYARLRHGRTERVRLVELPVERRPPVIKVYLQRAPGARPHIPVDRHAPLEQFAAIAPRIPVFRVEVADQGSGASAR